MAGSILITGGAGFLGSHLATALAREGDRVLVYDNLSAGFPENLAEVKEQVKFVHGDILDLSFLIRTMMAEKVDRVIHTAALVSFAPSVEKPALTAKINIEGTINVLEASRIVGAGRILDISSEEVYGDFQYEPADEDHPHLPTMPYAITKVAAEKYEEFFHRYFGMDVVIVRTSWVYGPGLPRVRVPKVFIENGLNGIPTHLASGGDYRVDHTYIEDFVQGALLAFQKEDLKHRVFNIASGKAYTFSEVAEMVKRLVPGAEITVGPGFLKHTQQVDAPRKGALSIERARLELGYEPKYDLFEGLRTYVKSYQKSGVLQERKR
jgi:UDP-glucose 4-epimerase